MAVTESASQADTVCLHYLYSSWQHFKWRSMSCGPV